MHGKGTADHADDAPTKLPPGAARRAHPREAGFGWTARLTSGALLPVLDLSAGGMRLGLRPGDPDTPEAGAARFALLEPDGAVVAVGLECDIVRVDDDALAVPFIETRADLAERHLCSMARLALAAIRPPGAPGHG